MLQRVVTVPRSSDLAFALNASQPTDVFYNPYPYDLNIVEIRSPLHPRGPLGFKPDRYSPRMLQVLSNRGHRNDHLLILEAGTFIFCQVNLSSSQLTRLIKFHLKVPREKKEIKGFLRPRYLVGQLWAQLMGE